MTLPKAYPSSYLCNFHIPRDSDAERTHTGGSVKTATTLLAVILSATAIFAGDDLKLNPHLNYNSDSEDGALITGKNMDAGLVPGKPAYVLLYGEGCFNSKRQARRTVELYQRYKGRVQFVVIDLDHKLSPPQEELKRKYYAGYIPHIVVLDVSGTAVYNASGEVDESVIASLLDKALR
jgi:hypothetical protein